MKRAKLHKMAAHFVIAQKKNAAKIRVRMEKSVEVRRSISVHSLDCFS
jgi:hypothetical protein